MLRTLEETLEDFKFFSILEFRCKDSFYSCFYKGYDITFRSKRGMVNKVYAQKRDVKLQPNRRFPNVATVVSFIDNETKPPPEPRKRDDTSFTPFNSVSTMAAICLLANYK